MEIQIIPLIQYAIFTNLELFVISASKYRNLGIKQSIFARTCNLLISDSMLLKIPLVMPWLRMKLSSYVRTKCKLEVSFWVLVLTSEETALTSWPIDPLLLPCCKAGTA